MQPATRQELRTAASTLQWSRGIYAYTLSLPTPKHHPVTPAHRIFGACVKIWTTTSSSSPLCTPRRTDSSLLLYPSLYLQYSRRCVFLPSLSYSRFTFHSVHLSVSLYLIFTDSTVRFVFNTYAAIRYPVIMQFEANVKHFVKLQRGCKTCLRIISAFAMVLVHVTEANKVAQIRTW